MLVPSHPDRRIVMSVDMESYSQQNNLRQYQSQRTLRAVMQEAVDEVGLDRLKWITQPTGDGEVAVLPTGVPEPVVVSRLVPEVDRILRQHNQSLIPEAKVRLRVAIHLGLVHLDSANGFAGEAVVTVCRLLNARQLKRALAAFRTAATALIVSDVVFRDVVRQQYDGLRPERFRRIEVGFPEKNFHEWAWIWVPDEDVNQLEDIDPPLDNHPPPPPYQDPAGSSAPTTSRTSYVVRESTINAPFVQGDHGTAYQYGGPR